MYIAAEKLLSQLLKTLAGLKWGMSDSSEPAPGLTINMKLIQLGGKYGSIAGRYAQVSDKDYEELSKYNWTANKRRKLYYASRTTYSAEQYKRTGNGTIHIQMHCHLIPEIPIGMERDHIDNNGLNNQRENLRVCVHADNMANMKRKGKWKGVTQENGKWRCILIRQGKRYTKRCKTEIEAVLKYNEWATEFFGEYAKLNDICLFPAGSVTKSEDQED